MKRIQLTLILISIAFSTYSQKVSLGPELGINLIPTHSGDLGKDFQVGYHFGTHLKYHISDHFRISTGLLITQKKKMYSYSDTSSVIEQFGSFISFSGVDAEEIDSLISSFGANTDVTEDTRGIVSETFIKVPLLANYKYKNFNIYLGPYAGLLLTANRKEETRTQIPLLNVIDISQLDSTGLISAFLPPADETTTKTNSGTDGLNKMDLGMNVGIGYEMNNLHFNLMYSQGFLDYRADKGDEDKSALNTFRFSIVYLFDLKPNREASARME